MRRKKDYKIYEQQCFEIIKENNLLTMESIAAFLPFSVDTFLDYRLEKSMILQKAITENRALTKQQLMMQWLKPNASPTCQIALYKLLASDEERKAMSPPKKEEKEKEDLYTKEAYLKSLEEMGKETDDAD